MLTPSSRLTATSNQWYGLELKMQDLDTSKAEIAQIQLMLQARQYLPGGGQGMYSVQRLSQGEVWLPLHAVMVC